MKLSKKIPARQKTLVIDQLKSDWLPMSPQFRAIRAKSRNAMVNCGWCGHAFVDGEMMGLAICHQAGNKALCQKCCTEALGSF